MPQRNQAPNNSKDSEIWDVIDVAASRVPQWVFATPKQAQRLEVQIGDSSIVVVRQVDE
jgi:hypothetical protein